ncbi:MAG: peroxiredoxin family protein [Oligoflexia bacterium]|jgi:peroxiredoxin
MSPAIDLNTEPLPLANSEPLLQGQRAPDFHCKLTTGTQVQISELLGRTHVLLNFIKGTWCPFCQQHMLNLRSWQKTQELAQKSTLLVISNEPIDALREFRREHSIAYLMASVQSPSTVFQAYGIAVQGENFCRPAVFLIEQGGIIRMAHHGTRGSELDQSCRSCGA